MHIFSPATHAWLEREAGRTLPPLTIRELLPAMSEGGVARAVIMSNAYALSPDDLSPAEQTRLMQEENDWVAEQVAQHPEQLVAFFSVNPNADGALEEIQRCARMGAFVGLKLHLANSKVDLRNTAHLARLREIFRHANQLKLPVALHMRTLHPNYGAADAHAFIRHVLVEAKEIPVQVAHTAGWGGYDPQTDAALGAFAEAIEAGLVPTKRLFFDLSAVVRGAPRNQTSGWSAERYSKLVARMRQLGVERFLFASDWPEWPPRQYWEDLERTLPLRPDELNRLRRNRAPWLE